MQQHIEYYTHKVSEAHVELDREALLQIAKREQVDWIIVRVQTFSQNGRPASRTLRLHRDMLEEPDVVDKPTF